MLNGICLECAKLFVLLICCICSLTTGQSETVECDFDRSTITTLSDTIFYVTLENPCINKEGKSLTICLLETNTNRSSISYKIIDRVTYFFNPPSFDNAVGGVGNIPVCADYNNSCCSKFSYSGSYSPTDLTHLALVFRNSSEEDYVTDNIQLLRVEVFTDTISTSLPLTFEKTPDTIDTKSTSAPIISEETPDIIDIRSASLPFTSKETLAQAGPTNLLAVYIIVPLSLVFIVALVVSCLCFLLRLNRKKYMQNSEKESHPMVLVDGNSKTSRVATLSNHYSYIEDGGFTTNYKFVQPADYEQAQSSQCMSANDKTEDEREFDIPKCTEDALYDQFNSIFSETLLREHVNILRELGSGQFGKVYKGVWSSPRGAVEVAIKTLKEGSKEEDRVKFLQEAAIMGQFEHSSIVTMHGIVTEGQPILLVLELLPKGDLRSHLISSKSNSNSDVIIDHTLLSYCRQVAAGMNYLANKHFVHRDLAARNILVSDDEICKIADFGMSRELLYQDTYESKGGIIPLKWTAPEALLYKTYSTASDVWSYGILLYEIWSVGHKPYEEIQNVSTTPIFLEATKFTLK